MEAWLLPIYTAHPHAHTHAPLERLAGAAHGACTRAVTRRLNRALLLILAQRAAAARPSASTGPAPAPDPGTGTGTGTSTGTGTGTAGVHADERSSAAADGVITRGLRTVVPALLAAAEAADVQSAAHAEELLGLYVREAWQGLTSWQANSATQLEAVLRLDVHGAPTAAARAVATRVLRLFAEARGP